MTLHKMAEVAQRLLVDAVRQGQDPKEVTVRSVSFTATDSRSLVNIWHDGTCDVLFAPDEV